MSYGIENIGKKLGVLQPHILNILFIANILILVVFIYSYVDDRNKLLVSIKIQEIETVADSVKSALHGVSDSYFLCQDRNWIGAPAKAINIADQSIDDWGGEVFNIKKKSDTEIQDKNNACSLYKGIDRPLEIDRPIQFSPGETLSRTGRVRMASYQNNYYFTICFGNYINTVSLQHQCDDKKSMLFSREYQYKTGDLYNNLALKIYVAGNEKAVLTKLDYPTSGKSGALYKNIQINEDSFTIRGQWIRTSKGLLIYEIELPQHTVSGKMLQQIRFVSSEYKYMGNDKYAFIESIDKMETSSIYKMQSSPITLNNKLFFSEKLISLTSALRNQYGIELENVSKKTIAELYPFVSDDKEQNKAANPLLATILGMNNALKEKCQQNSYCSVVAVDEYKSVHTHSAFLIKYSKPIVSTVNKNKIAIINVILNPDQFIVDTQRVSNFMTLISFVGVCVFLFIIGLLNFRKLTHLSQELSTIKRRIFHDIRPYRNDVLNYLKRYDKTNHDKANFCFTLLELHHSGISETVSQGCKNAREQSAVGGFRLSKAIDFVKERMKERYGDIIDINIQKGSDVLVWGDELHFVFILENIVKNAEQHCYKDSRIKITLSTDKKQPVGTIVTIFNQGNNIPERDKNKIFKLGYKKSSNGSGMGLYFVSKAMSGFGGYVECHNAIDSSGVSGVIFTLFLPNDCLDTISSEINLEELF